MRGRTSLLRTMRRASRLQWLLIGVLGATTLLAVASVTAYALSHAEPWFWTRGPSADAATTDANQQAALDLERQVISVMASTPRPERISIPLRAANAWLRGRLGEWISHGDQLDDPAGDGAGSSRTRSIVRACQPMVTIAGGRLVLAFRYPPTGEANVHSLHFAPVALSDRRMGVRLVSARMGRLPLPLALVRSRLTSVTRQLEPHDAAWLTAALSGRPFDPLNASGQPSRADGWRLTDLKLTGQEVDLALDAAAP